MSFEWRELGQTLRDSVFATWFGWSIISAIIVLPLSATIQSCWSDSTRETIEVAKLEAEHGDREPLRAETMKWMITRGVHPLVARCAILNSPIQQCASMMNNLEDEDRSIIRELIANPPVETVGAEISGAEPVALPVDFRDYVKGLDFGLRSPTE